MSLPTSALASVRRASLRRASLFAVPPRSRAASSAAPTPSPNPAPGPPRPNAPFVIFDRAAKATQRSRAALRRPVDAQGQPTGAAGEASRETDYVKRLVAESVAERVLVSVAPGEDSACGGCLMLWRVCRTSKRTYR
jgi:hypothetical protein